MGLITLGYMGAAAPKKTATKPAPLALPKKETVQASTSIVAAHFKKLGIPLGRPDPRLAFWRQPASAITAQLTNAINSIPMPPGGTAPGVTLATPVMPRVPAPAPKPVAKSAAKPVAKPVVKVPAKALAPSADAASLERKRVLVASAFEKTKAKHKGARPKDTDKVAVNSVAAHFRRAGIPLAKPDPKVAFWRLSEKDVADRLAKAFNSYKVK